MKLYIPACGDRIVLTAPWRFTLYVEHRNLKFTEIHKPAMNLLAEKGMTLKDLVWAYPPKQLSLTLPAKTTLECDRVYIRSTSKAAKGVSDNYDSVTWKVIENGKAAKHQRFWAKLSDCNGMECDIVSLYHERKTGT